MLLNTDTKYLIIAPDGVGSKGDEALLTGCLSLLNGDNVTLITPRKSYWQDTLVGRTHLFNEIYIPIEKIAENITFPVKLVVVAADTLDGSCGLDSAIHRIRAIEAAVNCGGEAWVFGSMRIDVPKEIQTAIKKISEFENVHFLLRDEISIRNYTTLFNKKCVYFPDFSFFCDSLRTMREQELKNNIIQNKADRKVIGLEISETMFRSFNVEITDERRNLFAHRVADYILQALDNPFFVLLCHDTRSWDEHWSDYQYAQAVYDYLIQKGYKNIVAIQPSEFMHIELLDFVNVCDVVVCGRMHMSITVYRSGVVPIIITGVGKNYTMVEKVRGMCMDCLGTDEFQLESLEELKEKIQLFFSKKSYWNALLEEKNNLKNKKKLEYIQLFREQLNVKQTKKDKKDLFIDETCRAMRRSSELQAILNDEHEMNENLHNQLKAEQSKNEALIIENNEKDTKIFNYINRINELESWEVIWRQRSMMLDEVYASRTWRYSHKFAVAVRKIVPAGSRRSSVLKAIVKPPVRFWRWLRTQKYNIEKAKEQKQYLKQLGVLEFPQFDSPLVSIIIPVYNQFNYTIRCLESIFNTCKGESYEIIIANDCSKDETKNISKIVHGVRVINNKTNLRFLHNCNNAAQSAKGKYILFLNNDTVVHKNWLQSLVKLMEEHDDYGMVGSKMLFSDGRLQEAGGIIWENGEAWNYGRLQDPENSEYNYVKEADYISGCSIMIKSELWKQIGGFDKRFAPAYCEDSDLAFQVREAGYKVMYQPLSVITHYEGVSNGTDLEKGQKKYQEVNCKKFFEKWHNILEKENFKNGQNIFLARDRSVKKPVLLMVDHYVPTFDQDAGSRTVYEYIKLFVNMGYNVKFIPDNFNRSEPYTTALQQMGVEVLYGQMYMQCWKNWVLENAEYIKYVFLNRPHISIKYIDFLRDNTSAKIIYYGHDLHFLREERQYEITKYESLLESSKKWRAIELSLMRKADMAYYPSCVEEECIHNISPEIKVKAIPAYIYNDVKTPDYRISSRKDLMFIGGFGHKPNVDAVKWFAKEIWPKINEKREDICVHILGSHPPKEIQDMNTDKFKVHGFVSDEELEQLYSECRISVVPLRYGAGIKGKVVEAMKNGIPVITTSTGAEGISGCEKFLAICDDAQQFAQKILDLYDDEKALSEMSQAECDYIRKNFSSENAMDVIKEDFS